MRVTIAQADLLALTSSAADVADRKTSLPITRCVRLATLATDDGPRLESLATDLYTSSRMARPCEVSEAGSVCTDAKALKDLVARLPPGDVSLAVEKTSLVVKAGRSRYRLLTQMADDFPPVPAMPDGSWEVDGAGLLASIEAVRAAVCPDDSRAHLAGLFMDGEDGVAVTTDGHRLHKREGTTIAPGAVLLPPKGVDLLTKMAGGVLTVGQDRGNLLVRRDGHTIGMKLVDESFPPWRKVVPTGAQSKSIFRVGRDAFASALKRLTYVQSSKGGPVTLSAVDGVLTLRASDVDVGEGSEEVPCDAAGKVGPIGMNARYLLDAIVAAGGDEVTLRVGAELDPLVVEGEGFEAVCMPMRL